MARRKEITAQDFDDLFIDAMGGDDVAEQEFRKLARTFAKRVNQQLLSQEKKEVTGEAYRRAQEFLGGSEERPARFRERNMQMELLELRGQVDEMLAFYSAKDYAIPYAKQSREEIAALSDALSFAGVDIEDARVTFWLNELFKTGAWKEYKKAHGKSTGLILAAQEQFQAGKTVDDLLAAYEDYASGRDDAPDLVESWERFAPDSW